MSAVAPLMQEGKHSLFTFRLFHGITASGWGRLLAQHRYAISPSRLPLVLQISAMSVVNSTLGSIQNLVFSDRIAASTIDVPPIFILGHWRTGTTYLYELIALDDAFAAPTTLECVGPSQFLVVGWLARILSVMLPFMFPEKRPIGRYAGRLGSAAGGRNRIGEPRISFSARIADFSQSSPRGQSSST